MFRICTNCETMLDEAPCPCGGTGYRYAVPRRVFSPAQVAELEAALAQAATVAHAASDPRIRCVLVETIIPLFLDLIREHYASVSDVAAGRPVVLADTTAAVALLARLIDVDARGANGPPRS